MDSSLLFLVKQLREENERLKDENARLKNDLRLEQQANDSLLCLFNDPLCSSYSYSSSSSNLLFCSEDLTDDLDYSQFDHFESNHVPINI